jgi:hypothetical protein
LGLQWKGDFAGSFFSNQPQPFPLETHFVIHGFVIQRLVIHGFVIGFGIHGFGIHRCVTYNGCGAFCSTV